MELSLDPHLAGRRSLRARLFVVASKPRCGRNATKKRGTRRLANHGRLQGGHNIQVCHRVRPSIHNERSASCVSVVDNDTIVLNSKPEAKSFTVDKVRGKLRKCETPPFPDRVAQRAQGCGLTACQAAALGIRFGRAGLWGRRYTEASV
jgi:hypothetical protein